jgi:hypothetical protein
MPNFHLFHGPYKPDPNRNLFIDAASNSELRRLHRVRIGDVVTVLDYSAQPDDLIPYWKVTDTISLETGARLSVIPWHCD